MLRAPVRTYDTATAPQFQPGYKIGKWQSLRWNSTRRFGTAIGPADSQTGSGAELSAQRRANPRSLIMYGHGRAGVLRRAPGDQEPSAHLSALPTGERVPGGMDCAHEEKVAAA